MSSGNLGSGNENRPMLPVPLSRIVKVIPSFTSTSFRSIFVSKSNCPTAPVKSFGIG